jgi:hypothetical protein
MPDHLAALDHGRMDPAAARYTIRINGHLGATMLSAFPALAPRHVGAHTVRANHHDPVTPPNLPGGKPGGGRPEGRPLTSEPKGAPP